MLPTASKAVFGPVVVDLGVGYLDIVDSQGPVLVPAE